MLAPMLSVRNGAKAVEFYQAAFGADTLFRLDDGGSVVAQLLVQGAGQGAEFWVADESPEHANFSPESLGGGTIRLEAGRQRREDGIRRACVGELDLSPTDLRNRQRPRCPGRRRQSLQIDGT